MGLFGIGCRLVSFNGVKKAQQVFLCCSAHGHLLGYIFFTLLFPFPTSSISLSLLQRNKIYLMMIDKADHPT
jgi:hypothetical protein